MTPTAPTIEDRLKIIEQLPIKHGSHMSFEHGACVMEMAAYLAGQEHSDRPPCVCPMIGVFLRTWNDALPDDETRTRLLRPLIVKVIDTKATADVELARVMLCIDWVCREFAPAWLALVPALKPHAERLLAFKPIQSWDDLDAILSPLRAAQKDSSAASAAAMDAALAAALAAALDAASAAAMDAALDAALAAALDAARDAASAAALDAALDAARDAALAAALDAARDAAKDALKPTTERLQQSAVRLVERMAAIEVSAAAAPVPAETEGEGG